MPRKQFKMGKVPPDVLEEIVFQRTGARNSSVILGPKIGEDAAVIKLSSAYIAVAADPITGSIRDIGRLVVHVNANDIATHGAKPTWMLLTILLPLESEVHTLDEIMKQVNETAKSIGVSVVGGHTEITPAVNQPILCGTMIGELDTSEAITSGGAQTGDHILVTKGIGLEGTTILASEKEQLLIDDAQWSQAEIQSAKRIQQELSILKDTEIAVKYSSVSAMHDPTEGGLAGALHELADASQKGFSIRYNKIPIAEITAQICEYFEIDPLSLISSGALLLTVPAKEATLLLQKFNTADILASDIGIILEDSAIRDIITCDGITQNLDRPIQDALWKALGKKSD